MADAPNTPPVYMRRNAFDPAPEMAGIREAVGVQKVITRLGNPGYLVTRHGDIKAGLADAQRFSNRGLREPSDEERGDLLSLDPPDHQRLRRMLTSEFTVRRMKQLEPRIVEIVDTALDEMERDGPPTDLVSTFALPIPSLVICELLGVPTSDRDDFQRRTASQLDMSLPAEEHVQLAREARAYMGNLVTAARREPGDNILGMLVRDHGDQLTDGELVGVASLLLVAGHETTANMLGLGALALLRHPDQLALVRDDPQAVAGAVEEMLRWLSVVQTAIPRTTTTEVDVAGVRIPKGQLVFFSLPAGNRDPDFLNAPDTLDIRRGATGHLAFGYGAHHCLGAPLARMEMRIAFPALLRRFPGLRLAEPYDEVAFRSFNFIYGLRSLQVSW
jgi:cytochrome P450